MPFFVLLVIVLVTAAIIDIRFRRIPNWLTYPAVLVGIGFHTLSRGLDGFLFSTAGMFLGLGLLVAFYLVGGMGAGDVKLMAAVGAFLGPKGALTAFVLTALVGGIYALVLLVRSGRAGAILARFGTPLTLYLSTLMGPGPIQDIGGAAPKLCYGVAITIGTLLSIALKGTLY